MEINVKKTGFFILKKLIKSVLSFEKFALPLYATNNENLLHQRLPLKHPNILISFEKKFFEDYRSCTNKFKLETTNFEQAINCDRLSNTGLTEVV